MIMVSQKIRRCPTGLQYLQYERAQDTWLFLLISAIVVYLLSVEVISYFFKLQILKNSKANPSEATFEPDFHIRGAVFSFSL